MAQGNLFRFQSPARPSEVEWVGGRYAMPVTVREGDSTLQPDVLLWLELPSGLLLTARATDPREPAPIEETLREAMARPPEGSPRRPARVRVRDSSFAEEARRALGNNIPVVVGPVPELDAVFAEFSKKLSGWSPEPSYLGDDVPPSLVEKLFSEAARLYRRAPWKVWDEEQVLCVDVPELGIRRQCLSVIGGAGEDFGLLLFSSFDTYLAFGDFDEDFAGVEDLDESKSATALLSVSFDHPRDLPPSLVREVRQHRWPLARANVYPVVLTLDTNRRPRQLSGQDYRVMTACVSALLSFLDRLPAILDGDPDTARETFQQDGLSVTLTFPHPDDFDEIDDSGFEPEQAPPVTARHAGRNDPCPCGSGKKYKKCHLDGDRAAGESSSAGPSIHELDHLLATAIARFADARFGEGWQGVELDTLSGEEPVLPLLIPWVTWTVTAEGKRVAEWFESAQRKQLSSDELEWIAAQKTAWLSVWEVTGVQKGRSVEVRDLLTGNTRTVEEKLGSEKLVPRDAVLARLVDYRGTSLFGGMFARTLDPIDAAEVMRRFRTKARVGKGVLPVERLREERIGRILIDGWQEAVHADDRKRSVPPRLTNHDGDPLLFVTESFLFEAERLVEIEKRLQSLEGAVEARETEDGEREITFLRAGDTVIGRAILGNGAMRLETNSERRAAALRARVRKACDGKLPRVRRKVLDPATELSASLRDGAKPPATRTPNDPSLILEAKTAHYRKWLDIPVPFLGGKSPRAAMRAAESRTKLDLLLRQIENGESRQPEGERIDVNWLRRELGIE